MYQPEHFREDRVAVQHQLIRDHPLGLLINSGGEGLTANFLPFLIDPVEGGTGVLRAHLARANDQWRALVDVEECLVVFQGPQAYVTPSWYATKPETGKVVPTWNYATVHAWGRPRIIQDAGWLRNQIEALTDQREAAFAEPWRVDDAPAPFIDAQIRGIVGLEIPITRMEGKWKVSQNRSLADRLGVANALEALHHPREALAALVRAGGA